MNSAIPETARRKLIGHLVAHRIPEVSSIGVTLLSEIKTEWRATEQSYHRSLLFAGAIYVLAELASAGSADKISVLGIEDIDPELYLRSACLLLGVAFYWAVATYFLTIKLAAIHYEVASAIHPSLSYERLYEALATPSLLTRGTTTVETVDKTRHRKNWQDWVQVSIPNIFGFFLIPLVLFALCARAVWISIASFGFDLWSGISIVAIIVLVTAAILRGILDFVESVDDYDMPELQDETEEQ